jgi:hypothetical protein
MPWIDSKRRKVQQSQKSFSMMIGATSRRAAASLMNAKRSSSDRRANSSVPRCAHFENGITHPAWHLCLRLSERLQIAVIDSRGETLNEIIIDVRLAGRRGRRCMLARAGRSPFKE